MRVNIKTKEEIEVMAEGGKKLSAIKLDLRKAVREGVSAASVDKLADQLIDSQGGKPSFKTVKGYSWATCINVNEGVVHGIPSSKIVFKQGDIVSVDVGLYYKGFHTDTSFSVLVGKFPKRAKFLTFGQEALDNAISEAVSGKRVGDISRVIESSLKRHKLSPIKALVGHGIGRELHEDPMIPCFMSGSKYESIELYPGMVLAIEVMYTMGKPSVILDEDGWTIKTKDGKIAALFEETVAVTSRGPRVLT